MKRNYWCYRVDTSNIDYFTTELNEGRLRQGWGWDRLQDLRNFKLDEGAGRNRPMFNKVKKGDILLVPRIPSWGEVAIVEASEDWNTGYYFDLDERKGDFGHIFPAKYLKKFTRYNENVTGNLRSTMKNPSRFWNINHYSKDVKRLIDSEYSELSEQQDHLSRLESSIGTIYDEVFNEKLFSTKLYDKLNEQFTREEWESVIVFGLRKLFPFYIIERTGGPEEVKHGTDILIKIPGIISNYHYAIAIQVKDYHGFVGEEVTKQINKAENYWESENIKLIEKIVIITKAQKDDNLGLVESDKNIKFIFANELEILLSEIGKCFAIGKKGD